MRRNRRNKHQDTETALANFALTFAKALLVIFVVLLMSISPPNTHTPGVRPNALYLIMVDWDGNRDVDVDVWVRDPNGRIVNFVNRELGFMALDRDDLGFSSDRVISGSTTNIARINEEIVSIRGIIPGEFVVNVNLFSFNGSDDNSPITVNVRIEKLNPNVETSWRGSVVMDRRGQEMHVVRFTMDNEGRITNPSNDLPISLRTPQPRSNTR